MSSAAVMIDALRVDILRRLINISAIYTHP